MKTKLSDTLFKFSKIDVLLKCRQYKAKQYKVKFTNTKLVLENAPKKVL